MDAGKRVEFSVGHLIADTEVTVGTTATLVEARALLNRVPDSHKIRSWIALQLLGFPSLKGVVISGAADEYQPVVEGFARELGVSQLLLRTDRPFEDQHSPRGGYLITVADVQTEVDPHLSSGRDVFLLEPRSPYLNGHNIGVNLWPNEPIQLEVVGPGFDASDLKRGDGIPHERWSIGRGLEVLDRWIADEATYRQSWRLRLEKVARMAARSVGEPQAFGSRPFSIRETSKFLAEVRSPLLQFESEYQPVDAGFVENELERIRGLESGLLNLHMSGEPFSVSLSRFSGDGLAYWDVVWPRLKYGGVGRP